tara:strand:+ start:23146 stop:23307 length:162 start_codon:yes stop_codon:yes gene_type:complete
MITGWRYWTETTKSRLYQTRREAEKAAVKRGFATLDGSEIRLHDGVIIKRAET